MSSRVPLHCSKCGAHAFDITLEGFRPGEAIFVGPEGEPKTWKCPCGETRVSAGEIEMDPVEVEEDDLFSKWKGDVARMRLMHQAELQHRDLQWKRKLQREVERARYEANPKVGDYRNWRGV